MLLVCQWYLEDVGVIQQPEEIDLQLQRNKQTISVFSFWLHPAIRQGSITRSPPTILLPSDLPHKYVLPLQAGLYISVPRQVKLSHCLASNLVTLERELGNQVAYLIDAMPSVVSHSDYHDLHVRNNTH